MLKIFFHKKIFIVFLVGIYILTINQINAFSSTVIIGRIKKVDYKNKTVKIKVNNDIMSFIFTPFSKIYIKSVNYPASLKDLEEDELLIPGVRVKLIVSGDKIVEMLVLEVPE